MILARLARSIASLALILPSISPAWAQTALAGPEDASPREARIRTEVTPCLNLRLSPGAASSVLDCIPPAVVLTLFESREGWSRVRLDDGRQGWVATRFLEVPQISSPAPETSAPETPANPTPQPEVESAVDKVPVAAPIRIGDDPQSRIGVLESQVLAYRSAETALREELERSRGESNLQLRSFQVEVDRLRSELDTSRETEVTLRRDLEAAMLPEAELLEEVESLKVAGSDLTRELEEARRSESRLRDQLEASSALAETLRNELRDSRSTDEELRREVSGARALAEAAQEPVASSDPPAQRADETPVEVRPPRTVEHEVRAPMATEPAAETVPTGPLVPVDTDVVELVSEPPIAEETVAEPPLPDPEELRILVTAWADAWSEQRVDDYLSFYSPAFEPADGMERATWESRRRDRLSVPGSIAIELEAIEILPEDSPGTREVRFLQTYESDSYRDEVLKSLVFAVEDGVWKIQRESALGTISSP